MAPIVPMTSIAGRYEITAKLGEGGMGVVYRAYDPPPLDRQVAVKTLHEFGDPLALELFYKECSALKSISHPNIVEIFDIGDFEESGHRKPFFVMPLLAGQTLEELIRRASHRLTVDRVVEIFAQTCRGLQAAHDRGLIHRDLKPSNIFVMADDSVKIIDFGIAHAVHAQSRTAGYDKGTLLYMAPEQVMDEPIDGRTDLYAFAVLACELLAGRRPYRSSTTAGLLREIVDGPPPDVAALLPPAAAPAAAPLLRALSRRPVDRPATAASLRENLRAAFEGSVSPASPPTPHAAASPPLPPPAPPPLPPPSPLTQSRTQHGIELPRPSARRTWSALAALAALVVVGVGLVWALVLRPRPVSPGDGATTTATASAPGGPAMPPLPGAAPDVVPPPEVIALPPATTTAPSPMVMARRADPAAPISPTSSVMPEVPGPGPVTETPATPPVEPPVPTAMPVTPPAAAGTAAPASFGGIVYIERIDDEDEEFDVTVRLDGKAVVVVDEDDEIKKTVPYGAITQATYYTRGPARFALRRSPSHWIRLEGSSPVVFRLSARAVDQVLSALEAHGVKVVR